MIDPNGPAFPTNIDQGMSIRTYLAGMVMAALSGTSHQQPALEGRNDSIAIIAKAAVVCADALIAELNKK